MPPGRGRRGRTEQRHPPETGRRDEGAPSRPTPPFPAFASQVRSTSPPLIFHRSMEGNREPD